jgi:uncharacterized protein (UPF0332 family)
MPFFNWYRVVGSGHHLTTFEALEIAMGRTIAEFAAYMDACRRKRNRVDYDCAQAASDTEAVELLEKAEEFRGTVENWIRGHSPAYAIPK